MLCYARDYRLQLFNNLSFDQLDRLRIEMKMKELGESGRLKHFAKLVSKPKTFQLIGRSSPRKSHDLEAYG